MLAKTLAKATLRSSGSLPGDSMEFGLSIYISRGDDPFPAALPCPSFWYMAHQFSHSCAEEHWCNEADAVT